VKKILMWVCGILIGGPILLAFIGSMAGESTPTISAQRNPTQNPPKLSKPMVILTPEKRKQVVASATKGLKRNRDDMERVTFFSPPKRNVLSSGFTAYLAVPDTGQPYVRVKSNFYGPSWVFFEHMKIMSDDSIIYERRFPYSEVVRDNSGGSVWETVDFAAEQDEFIALRKIAAASKTVVRFSGRERQHDHRVTKQEGANLQMILNAFENLSQALPGRI
jgi:hypothetical protein